MAFIAKKVMVSTCSIGEKVRITVIQGPKRDAHVCALFATGTAFISLADASRCGGNIGCAPVRFVM
jgi:hypothetical protein